jgi:hypothetical protein
MHKLFFYDVVVHFDMAKPQLQLRCLSMHSCLSGAHKFCGYACVRPGRTAMPKGKRAFKKVSDRDRLSDTVCVCVCVCEREREIKLQLRVTKNMPGITLRNLASETQFFCPIVEQPTLQQNDLKTLSIYFTFCIE